MCGISGYIHKNKCDEKCQEISDVVKSLQVCRGPDSQSELVEVRDDFTYHLHHQRLRIQDLSTGADQPMNSNTNNDAHIVFNGEIYNYSEIRKKFCKDATLKTHSDTEILLESLNLNNSELVLGEIRGMFSIGYLDVNKRNLVLARDRFGEKPLHYYQDENCIIFASQFDSIVDSMKILGKPITFDQESIYEYLMFGYFPIHTSFIKGVQKLSPGSLITFTFSDQISYQKKEWIEKWKVTESDESNVNDLETTINEAIELQLIGDVPIGVFLSGGCDSTLVSAIAQKLNSSSIHSFSLGFENSKFDETFFAEMAASQIGTNHHAFQMTANDAADILPMVLSAYPEPLGDPSVFPTTFLSREVRKFVTVALTGDGADELFFGYGRYKRYLELRKFNFFSSQLLRKIIFQASNFLPLKFKSKVQRIANIVSENSAGNVYISLVGFAHFNSLSDPEKFESFKKEKIEEFWQKSDSKNTINHLRELDVATYLTDNILVKVDRAAMKFSLETRAPYLDRKVSEFAAKAPVSWLYRVEQKRALKDILSKYVSRDVYIRQKMGFGAPLGDWFTTTLKSWCNECVENGNWDALGISKNYVEKLWAEIQVGDNSNVTYFWMLLALNNSATRFSY